MTSLDAQRAKNLPTNYAHLYRAEIDSKALVLPKFLANGHITLNTPVLVRSPKLSNVEPSQYLDGRPSGEENWVLLAYYHTVL